MSVNRENARERSRRYRDGGVLKPTTLEDFKRRKAVA